MKYLRKLSNRLKNQGKTRTFYECMAIYCLVTCGGQALLAMLAVMNGSMWITLLFGSVAAGNCWLGLWFLSKMKEIK